MFVIFSVLRTAAYTTSSVARRMSNRQAFLPLLPCIVLMFRLADVLPCVSLIIVIVTNLHFVFVPCDNLFFHAPFLFPFYYYHFLYCCPILTILQHHELEAKTTPALHQESSKWVTFNSQVEHTTYPVTQSYLSSSVTHYAVPDEAPSSHRIILHLRRQNHHPECPLSLF